MIKTLSFNIISTFTLRRLTRLGDDYQVEIVSHGYDFEREFYILHLGREFSVRSENMDYRLDISFQSSFNNQLRGLYYR